MFPTTPETPERKTIIMPLLKSLTKAAAAIALLATPFIANAEPQEEQDVVFVSFDMSNGEVVLELYHDLAPVTVDNFLAYVDTGFFDGTIIHRVVPDFVIQGGGYDTSFAPKATQPAIKNEWRNGLTNDRATISMARTNAPDSATSQFFINLKDNANLDLPRRGMSEDPVNGAAYAVFGRVVEGMDVVDQIAAVETRPEQRIGGMPTPVTPVLIKEAFRITGDRRAKLLEEHTSSRDAVFERAQAKRDSIQKKIDEASEADKRRAARAQGSKRSDDEQRADAFKTLEKKGYDIDPDKGTFLDSGVWIFDLAEGPGDSPELTDTVTIHYTGWFIDGDKFDSSFDSPGGNPLSLQLNRFVPGFAAGVDSMNIGGKRLIVIPGSQAYGDRGRPPLIPGNAMLIFEVELLAF